MEKVGAVGLVVKVGEDRREQETALGMEKGEQICDRSGVREEEEVKVVGTDWKWLE